MNIALLKVHDQIVTAQHFLPAYHKTGCLLVVFPGWQEVGSNRDLI